MKEFQKGKPHHGVATTNSASSFHSQGEVTLSSQLTENFRVQPGFLTSCPSPQSGTTQAVRLVQGHSGDTRADSQGTASATKTFTSSDLGFLVNS